MHRTVPLANGFSLDLSGPPLLMGILNVTPDSFSDGGLYRSVDDAVKAAFKMSRQGASIIDIGGESTRPGSQPVDADQELERILPVIKKLVARGLKVPISVDTYKASVAKASLDAGAAMINDISGFRLDKDMAGVVASYNAGVVLMHSRATPQVMQDFTAYENGVLEEVIDYLQNAERIGLEAGVNKESIIFDPGFGFGFGKNVEQNVELLSSLDQVVARTDRPILVGPSRKTFIGAVTGQKDSPKERLGGTVAAALIAVDKGAGILRVHDVAQVKAAVDMAWVIRAFTQSGDRA